MKQNNQSELFSIKGIVTGDAHILNFGEIEMAAGHRVYGLIDMDDGGSDAPLIGDYLHYYVGNQLSAYKASSGDLWQAYRTGLRGKSLPKPDLIQAVEKKSPAEFAKEQSKYIDKRTSAGHFNGNAELEPLSQAPVEVQQMYQSAKSVFLNEMRSMRILDSGYKSKEEGGSQGLPRFWFLVEQGNEKHIWEFKQETDPATSLYAVQILDPQRRFETIARVYRPKAPVLGPYKFIQAGSQTFLLRERLKNFLKLDPTKNKDNQSVKDGRELAVYLANQLGLWQSSQASGTALLNLIEQDPQAAKTSLDQLSQSYVEEMRRQ